MRKKNDSGRDVASQERIECALESAHNRERSQVLRVLGKRDTMDDRIPLYYGIFDRRMLHVCHQDGSSWNGWIGRGTMKTVMVSIVGKSVFYARCGTRSERQSGLIATQDRRELTRQT